MDYISERDYAYSGMLMALWEKGSTQFFPVDSPFKFEYNGITYRVSIVDKKLRHIRKMDYIDLKHSIPFNSMAFERVFDEIDPDFAEPVYCQEEENCEDYVRYVNKSETELKLSLEPRDAIPPLRTCGQHDYGISEHEFYRVRIRCISCNTERGKIELYQEHTAPILLCEKCHELLSGDYK